MYVFKGNSSYDSIMQTRRGTLRELSMQSLSYRLQITIGVINWAGLHFALESTLLFLAIFSVDWVLVQA
jgi:hypothetical protein